MMKKFLAVILVCVISTYISTTTTYASNFQNTNSEEDVFYCDNIDNYDKIPILTIECNDYNQNITKLSFKNNNKTNIEKARKALLQLDLSSRGLSYIEDTCLLELDELALDKNCILNEYTVLVPKSRAKVPSHYATYRGREYYSSSTSLSNITLEKNSRFGSNENLKKWSQNAISLGLCFNSNLKITIPWTLITSSLPNKYTIHTSDWMDSYININPVNRAVYVKEGSRYINVANREYGKVRPYFVYHLNDASSTSPTETIHHKYTTYPDASGSSKNDLLYNAEKVYNSGARPVYFKLKNIVDLIWKK